ncbi:MAG: hemerythrin domain-containing protein [Pseudomonadota bacterium]
MSDPLADLDEAGRPTAPKLPQATDEHRRAGRHLAAIHRHYLQDMARIKMVIERIESGDTPPERLRDVVLSMEMAENYRAFGSLCGQGCHMLSMHHDIEENSMFTGIEARASAGLGAVVAKQRAEHKVVHARIERLEAAALDLLHAPTDTNFLQAATAFRDLEATVRSHFRYEETELEEAIGVYLGVV